MSWRRLMVDVPLRHGYTTQQVERLVSSAARNYGPTLGLDIDDRMETAWFGIVERLYTASERPSEYELGDAARRALSRLNRQDLHDRGFVQEDRISGPGQSPGFARYWFDLPTSVFMGADPGPAVVERVAMAQILSELRPSHRKVLIALARHGHYAEAAASVGMGRDSFSTRVVQARAAFMALWHEHETPHRSGKRDQRVGRITPRPRVAATLADPKRTARALADVEAVFAVAGVERMHSADVVSGLAAAHPGRYGDWDQRDLAFVLRTCGVPTNVSVNIGGHSRYGYRLADIIDAQQPAQEPTADEEAARALDAWLAAHLPPEPPDHRAEMVAFIAAAGPEGVTTAQIDEFVPVHLDTRKVWVREAIEAGAIIRLKPGRYVATQHAATEVAA